MPNAARVSDPTAHGAPLGAGPGSPDVSIGNLPAWRALPTGPLGAAVEAAAGAVHQLMSAAGVSPVAAAAQLVEIQARMQQAAAVAAAQGNAAAASASASATASLNAANASLTAAWAAAAPLPGGEPGATIAYTEGLKSALAGAAGVVFSAIAGMADVHQCPVPCPTPPHGPGVVTQGSRHVRINGLPAARQGDRIIEACGGSDPIVTGCPTVNIGE